MKIEEEGGGLSVEEAWRREIGGEGMPAGRWGGDCFFFVRGEIPIKFGIRVLGPLDLKSGRN